MNLNRPGRFLSLDVFRGMTIAMMILVNNPGSWRYVFAPLDHAKWFGCTPTDLVFPFFLFAVGNAMSFSMKKYEALGQAAVLWKIFRRTALIFLISYAIHFYPFFRYDAVTHSWSHKFHLDHIRIMGVLQRIALAYCAAALLIHYLGLRRALLIGILILPAYWGLLMWLGDPGAQLTLEGNAVLKLDRFLFGPDHLYHGEGVPFDPEGVLSTLPAVSSVIFGYRAGVFIQQKGKSYECVAGLFLAGTLMLALALCWNPLFPIAKKLWTSSFVLYTTGLALYVIAVLIWLLEIRAWNPGNWSRFFTVFGKNPLFIYILADVVVLSYFAIPMTPGRNMYGWLYTVVFQPLFGNWMGSLAFAVFHVLLFWLVGLWLDRKKIYIRV
ncbi:DUF5009 domain-containing protein [Compostibacter hankyongensis]|uniref:Acyltransferase family protein n=1 Tax=Compostibacter hankyongensis TaxID=1007089 RepID=A0ABP8FFL9_9BACT